MGCLLGLLKQPAEQIAHAQKPKNVLCPPEKHPLEKEYGQLMEEFVRLQQPYEQISIQEFSTDIDYVRRMTSVLEAGNQFTIRFRNFIDTLLAEYSKEALLFIFIDDVDLSTNRCSDVVKTLLSYLSHPSIVTVLAGDLDVFGEALTLDFLRQEQIPDTEFVEKSYLVTALKKDEQHKKLIARKKQLAYEYLKKVMPPNNRHYILRWTLSMRGDFRPVGMEQSEIQENQVPSLRELLVQSASISTVLKNYFSNETNQQIEQSDHKISDFILYHIFDFTARGLMSSYYAIQSLVLKKTEDKEDVYASIKFVLEAVVAANYQLSSLQNVIFHEFLILGTTSNMVQIRFDNFNAWIDIQLPYLKSNITDNNATQKINREMEWKAFQIFVFLDWAIRLLDKGEILKTLEYETAKRTALCLLCVNGEITEKSEQFDMYQRTAIYALSGVLTESDKVYQKEAFAYTAITTYFELSFPLAVRYFQVLDISRIIQVVWRGIGETNIEKIQSTIDFVNVLYHFYGENDLQALSQCFAQHTNMLQYMNNIFNIDKSVLILSIFMNQYFKRDSEFYNLYFKSGCQCENIPGDISPKFSDNLACLNEMNTKLSYITTKPSRISEELKDCMQKLGIYYNYNDYNEYLLMLRCCEERLKGIKINGNTMTAEPFYNAYVEKMAGTIFDEQKQIQPLKQNQYTDTALQNQIAIIRKIDENNLWNFDEEHNNEDGFIDDIKKYIQYKLKKIEEEVTKIYIAENKNPIFIEISTDVKEAFFKLKFSYAGSSMTLAQRCKKLLEICFNPDTKKITTMEYIAIRLILQRLIYSTAWYGKTEARALLKELEQCQCNIFDVLPDKSWIDAYQFWFHCYCRYQSATYKDNAVYKLSNDAEKAKQIMEKAMHDKDIMQKKQYMKELLERTKLNEELLHTIPDLFKI